MVHPDDRAGAGRGVGQRHRTGHPFDLVYRIIRADSEERWVHARAVPRVGRRRHGGQAGRHPDGRHRTGRGRPGPPSGRDPLRDRLRAGRRSAPPSPISTGSRSASTRPCAASWGGRRTLLVGRRWTEFTHPDEVPLWQAVARAGVAGHDTYEDERRYVRPDGSVVWASSHVSLVRDESGKPQYFFVQLQDITERKQMEARAGPPGSARLADRPAEPGAAHRPPGPRPGRLTPAGLATGRHVPRRRPLQDGQRLVGSQLR